MFDHLFTDKEAELILELLQAEAQTVTTEARHTDTPALRKELHERLRTVKRLIQRFGDLRAGVYGGQDVHPAVPKTTGGSL
jgi:hypothetical protein